MVSNWWSLSGLKQWPHCFFSPHLQNLIYFLLNYIYMKRTLCIVFLHFLFFCSALVLTCRVLTVWGNFSICQYSNTEDILTGWSAIVCILTAPFYENINLSLNSLTHATTTTITLLQLLLKWKLKHKAFNFNTLLPSWLWMHTVPCCHIIFLYWGNVIRSSLWTCSPSPVERLYQTLHWVSTHVFALPN